MGKKKIKPIQVQSKVAINGLHFGFLSLSALATPRAGRRVKSDTIVSSKRTVVDNIRISEEGEPLIMCRVSLDTLERFYKQLKKDLPTLRKINKKSSIGLLGLRHLGPDLTIAVYKKAPKVD